MTAINSPALKAPSTSSRRPAGLTFAGLFIGSLIFSAVLGSGTFPSPLDSEALAAAYFAANEGAVLGMGIMQALAALALAAFVAVIAREMAAGGAGRLARAAGFLSAASLEISAVISIAIASMGVTGESLHRLHDLTFLAGGQIHVPLLGILVGAGAIAFSGPAPRWTTVLGYVSAALCLLSLLSFASQAAMLLLPLGRFTAILWMVNTALRPSFRA